MIPEIYYATGASDAWDTFTKEAQGIVRAPALIARPKLRPKGEALQQLAGVSSRATPYGPGGVNQTRVDTPRAMAAAPAQVPPTRMSATQPSAGNTVASVTHTANVPPGTGKPPGPTGPSGPSPDVTTVGNRPIPNNQIQHMQLIPQQAREAAPAAPGTVATHQTVPPPPPGTAPTPAKAAEPAAGGSYWSQVGKDIRQQLPSAVMMTALPMLASHFMSSSSNQNQSTY